MTAAVHDPASPVSAQAVAGRFLAVVAAGAGLAVPHAWQRLSSAARRSVSFVCPGRRRFREEPRIQLPKSRTKRWFLILSGAFQPREVAAYGATLRKVPALYNAPHQGLHFFLRKTQLSWWPCQAAACLEIGVGSAPVALATRNCLADTAARYRPTTADTYAPAPNEMAFIISCCAWRCTSASGPSATPPITL